MIDLTPQEIARITGRSRYRAQAKVLDGMGIPYSTRPDGSLVVSRLAFERAQGGVSEKEARRLADEEPDFEALMV